jgi:hypothetical protein
VTLGLGHSSATRADPRTPDSIRPTTCGRRQKRAIRPVTTMYKHMGWVACRRGRVARFDEIRSGLDRSRTGLLRAARRARTHYARQL